MRPTRRRIGVVFDPIDRNYFWFNPGSLTDFERFCRPEFISPARPFAQNNRSWRLRPSSDGRCRGVKSAGGRVHTKGGGGHPGFFAFFDPPRGFSEILFGIFGGGAPKI